MNEGLRGPEGRPAQVRRAGWCLLGLLLSVYLLTGKGFSEILDAEGYYLIARALVEDSQVSVVPELSSAVLRGDEPTRDGRAFLHFGIGYPVLIAPFYAAGSAVGQALVEVSPRLARFERFVPRAAVSVALALVTALTGVAVMWLLLELGLGLGAGVAGGLLFGLATYAWPYAKIGFYEPLLALCQVLALLWAARYAASGQVRWLAASGFAAAWGVAAKPSLGLLLPVLMGYAVWAVARRGREGWPKRLASAGAAMLAGALPWVLMMGWYNAQRAGSVTDVGYSPGNYVPWLDPAHIWEAVRGNLASPGRSFFVYSPIALLAFTGIPWLWRHRRADAVAYLVLGALTFGFFCTRTNWATIQPWGPRYLEPLAPLAVVLAMPGLVGLWRRRAGRWLVGTVVGLSVAVQLLAIAMPYGAWLDRVREETGSGFSAVFQPRYCPLWGQWVLLREAKLTPIRAEASDVATGQPSEAFKQELRTSPDFWFAYAYRLGVPAGPLVAGAAALAMLAVACAMGLRRALLAQSNEHAGVATTDGVAC